MSQKLTRAVVLAGIALAGPMALGLDLVARRIIVGGQPEDVQQFMAEHVTRIAWFFLPGPLIGGLLGFFLYPSLYRRTLARLPSETPAIAEASEHRADLTALMIATTAAQAPALLGDVSVMLGARLTPALCTTALSVTAVLLIGALSGPARTSRNVKNS